MKYIALLRGINVSGQKIIKMEDLKSSILTLNFSNVKTYIQSGNIVFESEINDYQEITKKIESIILKDFGFVIPVCLRSQDHFIQIIENQPFKDFNVNDKTYGFYVSFLSQMPDNQLIEELITFNNNGVDTIKQVGQELYIICHKNGLKETFTNVFIEKKLKVNSTIRNWNTVNKLANM